MSNFQIDILIERFRNEKPKIGECGNPCSEIRDE